LLDTVAIFHKHSTLQVELLLPGQKRQNKSEAFLSAESAGLTPRRIARPFPNRKQHFPFLYIHHHRLYKAAVLHLVH